MNMSSLGDLAYSMMLRTRSSQFKQQMSVLTEELSTGRVSDVRSRTGSDYAYLAEIERNSTLLDSYALATSEVKTRAEVTQTHLEKVQNTLSGFSDTMATTRLSPLPAAREHAAVEARQNLDKVIATLNASSAGQHLFSGVATDDAPLAGADVLLTELRAEVSGLTLADDVELAVSEWFADPNGFEAAMYRGSDNRLQPVQIGAAEHVSVSITAKDEEFRAVLKSLVLPVLAMDTSLSLSEAAQADLMNSAHTHTLNANGGMTTLRGELGFAEARIEEVATRNASARAGLEISRNNLIGADPYETAVRLEEVQAQLETLYTLTARSSRLSLLNFLS
ncbi:MAG: flagellar biosynthesis protein FlgL [Rhodobacteraceae bacterium]|nr:flagellar biosynthesis protein FlgL [Paracoccaceae bacterium]